MTTIAATAAHSFPTMVRFGRLADTSGHQLASQLIWKPFEFTCAGPTIAVATKPLIKPQVAATPAKIALQTAATAALHLTRGDSTAQDVALVSGNQTTENTRSMVEANKENRDPQLPSIFTQAAAPQRRSNEAAPVMKRKHRDCAQGSWNAPLTDITVQYLRQQSQSQNMGSGATGTLGSFGPGGLNHWAGRESWLDEWDSDQLRMHRQTKQKRSAVSDTSRPMARSSPLQPRAMEAGSETKTIQFLDMPTHIWESASKWTSIDVTLPSVSANNQPNKESRPEWTGNRGSSVLRTRPSLAKMR